MNINEQQDPSNGSDDPPQPQGWSKEEKYYLLQALKCTNSCATEGIKTVLPTKSAKEIEDMLNYYKKRAEKDPLLKNKVPHAKRFLNKMASKTPIAMWAKLLTDSFSFKELENETATALHLIAEFENIPAPVCTGGVDFRLMYHTLANAIEGKTLPDNKMIHALLEKCILETAFTGKSFMRKSAFHNVIKSINFSEKEINIFPRPTDNHELAALRHLSSQRKYNPLNIAEGYLKPSFRSDKDVM